MSKKVQAAVKKSRDTRENKVSQMQKTAPSQSISSPVEQILFLQRTIGNQTVERLLKSGKLQAKFRIGQPGDIYEQEADRVAEQVIRMPLPPAAPTSYSKGDTVDVRRKCLKCDDEEKVWRKPGAAGTGISEAPDGLLQALGQGQPLSSSERSFFEPRFGHDFSGVRVHADAKAAEAAQAVDAQAFTMGRDVVFGKWQYAPGTSRGQRLLAHELTHVVQQHGVDAIAGHDFFIPQGRIELDAPGRTIQRKNGGGGKAKTPPPWTVDDLKKMLDACDGGLGIWAKAKKANKDKDPVVKAGKTRSGGFTSQDTITLEETSDRCNAAQVLIQELSNMSRAKDFDKLSSDARAGDLARDAFIKGFEKIEYETGVKNVLTAFDACKDIWKCKTAEKEWARKAKDFEDYFKNFLSNVHKEGYGKWWDDNCKAAYDKKHPKK
ncbi:MAG TPA: DUF4157 domain-containing protein [Candidatus Methanoperedenaceae archaeon]|nr:DUF4157 domain-containing protein [Candidatus Methanoperedenaceae archaeon]